MNDVKKSNCQKTILDNGVRVVTELIPHVRSVAVGFWFTTGSRDEPEGLSGIAHFLEHMNFKGTKKRSAAQIAREIESRGGHLNAFTSKEVTCYLARVLDEQIPRSIDVLSDITRNSIYDQKEIDLERNVILEELKNTEDTPDELVYEHFFKHVFGEHPLGRSILGHRDSLKGINHNNLNNYSKERYNGSNVVIAATGNLDHQRLVRLVKSRFTKLNGFNQERYVPEVFEKKVHKQQEYTSTQQAHILFGCKGLDYNDKRRFVLSLMSTILGGGMSSRLFQNIREKEGMAYSVYSFVETFFDTGLFAIYAGTTPEKLESAKRLIRKEVRKLVHKSISDRELNRTKDQLKGNLMLGLESPSSRMHRLARMEINSGEFIPIEYVIEQINQVGSNDIQELAVDLFENQALYETTLLPN
ncbi:insulinase family protein [bacterium]|nr:insulinase family protein [bacterium]